jgi:integrase
VRRSVLYPAIERANVILGERNVPTIPDGSDGQPRVTFHSLRRTYASLCAEANADPA